MSKPYKECPRCGAHLDHGEICTCRQSEPAAPQENPREPVLIPGE